MNSQDVEFIAFLWKNTQRQTNNEPFNSNTNEIFIRYLIKNNRQEVCSSLDEDGEIELSEFSD